MRNVSVVLASRKWRRFFDLDGDHFLYAIIRHLLGPDVAVHEQTWGGFTWAEILVLSQILG